MEYMIVVPLDRPIFVLELSPWESMMVLGLLKATFTSINPKETGLLSN